MDLNFGINGGIAVEAARPVLVDSSTPIGIVVYMADKTDFVTFNNPTAMLDWVKAEGGVTTDIAYRTADAMAEQNVNTKLVVKFIDAHTPAAALAALDVLKTAPYNDAVLVTPNLVIVPELSYNEAVATKMDSVAAKFKATAIVDVNAPTEAAAQGFAANFGSRFILLYRGQTKIANTLYPTSAVMAGLIAYWDAGGDNGHDEFGYARSHSNRVAKGVHGAEHLIEYFDGEDCEARRLRQKGVGAIVQDVGWRSYGFETTDIDPIWQSLERARAFYRWLDAIIKANKWARDRSADQLIWVKKTCAEFFKNLTGAGIALGYSIDLDPYRSDVTAGKFTFVIRTANMPSIRELNFELVFTDSYNDAFINWLNDQ